MRVSLARLSLSIYAAGALVCVQSAFACTPPPAQSPNPGESDEAFHARIKADQEAAQRYLNASEHERAAIDQSRWWNGYSTVFLARIEKVKIGKHIYGKEIFAPYKPKLRWQNGRAIPPEPVVIIPFPKYGSSHHTLIRPLRFLKGAPTFATSWQGVGGWTSCGGAPDGELVYASPGDHVIIFADLDTVHFGSGKTKKEWSLYGIRKSDAAAPELLNALKPMNSVTQPKD